MRYFRMIRITGLLLAALALSSCALGLRPDAVLGEREIPTAPANEIIVTRSEGRLEYRGNCLFLRRDAGNRVVRLLVIWPLHTRFDGAAVVPGESTTPVAFTVGEKVVIHGSAVEWAPHIRAAYPQLARWRERCGEWLVFVGSIDRVR